MHRYQKAGVLSLFAVILGALSFVVPSSGAGYVVGPLFLLVGCASGWFWYKGQFGSDQDKNWVESTF
jgi:hypothetical protein